MRTKYNHEKLSEADRKALSRFCLKNKEESKMPPIIKSIHVNGNAKEAIATNGKAMAVLLGCGDKTSIHPEGDYYPLYSSSVPEYRESELPDTSIGRIDFIIDMKKFRAVINIIKKRCPGKIKDYKKSVCGFYDGVGLEVYCRYDIKNEWYSGGIGQKNISYIQLQYLIKVYKLLKQRGNKKIKISFDAIDKGNPAILFCGEKEYIVVMPIRYDSVVQRKK